MIEKGDLSLGAKKIISGYMSLAKSLTAFGNTVPTSYLRLVPHQEAPTKICWGFRDRSALVRVPLSWFNAGNMVQTINPGVNNTNFKVDHGQTVEFRSADGVEATIYRSTAKEESDYPEVEWILHVYSQGRDSPHLNMQQ